MTTSRKNKAPDRGTTSKSAAKRKVPDEDRPSSEPKKSRVSIAELLSSQQSNESNEGDGVGWDDSNRNKRAVKMDTKASPPLKLSNKDMYTFTSKSATSNVVDLTSSPELESQKRKVSFTNTKTPFNPHQGPKKLVVKNLRTVPRIDPQQYFERTWAQEDKALDAIFRNEKQPYSLEELYKGAENVCRQGKAAELYARLSLKCDTYLSETVRDNIRRDEGRSSDVEFLQSFIDAWATWQKQLLTIRQIFYYLDQTFLLRSADNPSITEMGLIKFRSCVFQDDFIKPKALNGVVALIAMDRRGTLNEKDRLLLIRAADSLHELSIYSSDFEPLFHSTTQSYFRSWKETDANRDDLAAYVTNCSYLLEREMGRSGLLTLDRSTILQISELFDEILVSEEIDILTNEDSILDLLEADKFTEVKLLYALLQRKSQGEMIAPTFSKYVEMEGSAIVFDEKREIEMVVRLLDFKRRLDRYLKYCFQDNETLGNSLHKAFESFINKTKKSQSNWDTDNNKPGEMIAKHVDLLLKGGVKAIPGLQTKKPEASNAEDEHDFDEGAADEDAEINQHLSNALDLFRFVHGKAVFEAFYKKDLARRLLMGRSASFDAERNMLTRLKNECGAAFTHNLESMFKDMDLAREEMMSYNQLLDDRGGKSGGPDLSVNVLSSAAWPTYPDVSVTIPPNVAKVMADFETHYKAKHSGRKLTWKHSLAHCQLRANFPRGRKELVVSGFQAIVLLLFNDIPADKHLTYTEIRASSGLVDAELKRTLQSLACAKYQVLKKHPRGRDVNETDTFTFNAAFVDPKLRVKINQIQLKETKEENKETHERVAADRHYETQAAIVRIMKSRKKIGHNELIVEVIKATMSRGVLDQADIKRNIEKLIEKDYMERDEGNTYSYVA
ncbi:hypothetical protein PV08_01625 [Exophiala spinifera]|uniref:Cullin family profile domain-containing protein n=1 Tax=Exophiala spinifera TaxID=91928 RepID=A0A0D1Z0F0_9EURO|nr:uncharacterized protein PV08_01625 [Exophiala spinifera]KIW21046.1 hypothetical protein PV08_01625 [Exophiala spinifera]